MGTVLVEYWSKDKFAVQRPVCDLCSTPLTKFPAPVVRQPFDFLIIHARNGRTVGGCAVVGGLALCPECFKSVVKELKEKGETIVEVGGF